ncbi:MAG TPA: glycosyltransferase [Candidatus Limnocylindria bacterium]|nr:glycosyltransferase [Candidatus Limnocylindria bacterium]
MTAELVRIVLGQLDVAILSYFLIVNSFYAALLASASVELWTHARRVRGESRWRVLGSDVAPTITVLSPAYNEAMTIAASVAALMRLRYANLEVIVINDGSKDQTFEVLRDRFALEPVHPIFDRRLPTAPIRAIYRSRLDSGLLVIDKDNGGKADSLNAGLDLAAGDLVCAIDADTLIEPDALQRMVRPFLLSDGVLAAGGTIRVVNDCLVEGGRVTRVRLPGRLLPALQVIEYLRAFLFGRLGWNRFGGNLIISGAFGLFRRDAVIEAGGYTGESVGEDMELVVRLRRRGRETGTAHQVDFIPDPVAWTEVPESRRVLGRQRDRWHRGLADTLWRHRALFLRPRYGALGLVGYPYFVLVELLAPVIEALGIVGLIAGLAIGAVDVTFALLFFLVAYGYGLLLTYATLLLEELSYHRYSGGREMLRLLLVATIETFGYRQLTVLWRLRGLVAFVRGRRAWGAMERRGFRAG